MVEPAPGSNESGSSEVLCPSCGGQMTPIDETFPGLLRCAACGEETLATGSDDETDETPANADSDTDELNALRIRQLATMRRAAYRARSYTIIAAIICAVAAGDLVYYAWLRISVDDWGFWTIAFLALALISLLGAVAFLKRSGKLYREAQASTLPADSDPPDFSALSDGSEQWKHLEDIR